MTQCVAEKKNGERCTRNAEKGSLTCWQHRVGKTSPSRSPSPKPSKAAVKPPKAPVEKTLKTVKTGASPEAKARKAADVQRVKKRKLAAIETLKRVPTFPAPRLAFFEKQSELLCGQHALNNFFRNTNGVSPRFVSTDRQDYVYQTAGTFDLLSFCRARAVLLAAEMGHEFEAEAAENVACHDGGNYDVNLLHAAAHEAVPHARMSDIVYDSSERIYEHGGHEYVGPALLEAHLRSSLNAGLIVNISAAHYVAVVHVGNDPQSGWVIVDSIGGPPKVSYTAQGVMIAIIARGFVAAFSITLP